MGGSLTSGLGLGCRLACCSCVRSRSWCVSVDAVILSAGPVGLVCSAPRVEVLSVLPQYWCCPFSLSSMLLTYQLAC